MPALGWLGLLACFWTTGDLVVDLVFETPGLTSDASAEEPDNAAEHLLMPSEQADRLTAGTLAATPTADFDAPSLAVTVLHRAAPRAAPPLHAPPRNKPVSCSVPLRI
jgi:hypothetical protein